MGNSFKKSFLIFLLLFSVLFLDAQEDLIPMPQQITWRSEKLDISKGLMLIAGGSIAHNELEIAERIFKNQGVDVFNDKKDLPKFRLAIVSHIEGIESPEGYQLSINTDGISVLGTTAKGIFYGLQTLSQFTVFDKKISFVEIKDEPAFSFRGFLLDVGRNYQPVKMIKEQIDIMANYKLNVLHFHFTEDIAWRLESKKYPGLTDAKIMTRWPGKFYTVQEFQELIDYCTERHILFLPEIDMPGHSQAFERYFGVNMQNKQGIKYVKELLKEFSETFPKLKHFHIGGDEVKISNRQFMPEITQYVESLGYKTYGWHPGSNLERSTIRQMWMGGPEAIDSISGLQCVDSKHLYLNHMDPLETVTTLFFRRFAEQSVESNQLSGAILCSWPDRAVSKPEDMFLQNAIYPGMITFAERIWKGSGESGWKANLPSEQSTSLQQFKEFENRLLIHKIKYFTNLPFPYVKQTDLQWELIGPFDNKGDLSKVFSIERDPFAEDLKVYKTQIGGTVILRHWWADVIPGVIDTPHENTTFYARTKIWSNREETRSFWIGFHNISRSYSSDSPPAGSWDELQSQVFVNLEKVEPPLWKQAGQQGELEIPLLDEGYSYREPTRIQLRKGWNEILIKLPVSGFKGKDWKNPVKWMFTFIPYQ